ncbi:MAG TPA: phosphatase PAP2 family protein [bacterium]|nr:phosphatase PAP2 family protein [bacterium]
MNALLQWDRQLFALVNQRWTSPALDGVMRAFSDWDPWRIPVILIVVGILVRGSRAVRIAVLFAILAVAVSDQMTCSLVKPQFDRPRPFKVEPGARKLLGAHDGSFPSAHAANSTAAATFVALRFPRLRPILILPAIVSYSRVYVGVHYPLDVLGGIVLGSGIGAAFAGMESALRRRFWPSKTEARTKQVDETGGRG